MAKHDRMFETIQDFLAEMANLEPEVYATELKKFNAVERANILATEYIAADIYPQSKFSQANIKLAIRHEGKNFYPLIGWNPDAAHPGGSALVPPIRRWLNKCKQ